VNPAALVSKVVLRLLKISLNVARESIATRVKDLGLIEVVPANTPRFKYDPVILAPPGFLTEPEAKNSKNISNINRWSRTRVTITATIFAFTETVYILQGNGTSGQYKIMTSYPTVSTDTYRTLSIYMKNGTNRCAQIFVGGDTIFASFDRVLGLLGSKHPFIESSIIRAGECWYRSVM
jgi:hypothetical protein